VFANGHIAAVGPRREVLARHPSAEQFDAGDALVLPGLVNAHTHLELSHCTASDQPASFTDWLASLPARIGVERDFAAAGVAGAKRSVEFGVTTVGDISQQAHLTRPVLRDGPLRVVSYGEVLGIGATRVKVDALLQQAIDSNLASDGLTIGVSPHAPYSLECDDYFRVAATARELRLPVAAHVAELPYEAQFLQHQSGPFRELMERWGIWRDGVHTFRGTPIQLAKAAGVLDSSPSLLAHVNYCNDEELATLAAGRASVVYCPRTHAYFQHPPHRWRDMLAVGINVAVGTDSCASSPDLNLVDDLRLLHRLAPEQSAAVLWEMATIRGARAVGAESTSGSLTVGKVADVTIYPVQTNDPLTEILEAATLPSEVWVAGERVFNRTASHRRHPASPD
jgi:cytosine/adenosine deaminase-related metal-dependent hydrolase